MKQSYSFSGETRSNVRLRSRLIAFFLALSLLTGWMSAQVQVPCPLNLPSQASFQVFFNNGFLCSSNGGSYFDVNIVGVGQFRGWCSDAFEKIDASVHKGTVPCYSPNFSFDQFYSATIYDSLRASCPTLDPAVPSWVYVPDPSFLPDACVWNELNYLLNHKKGSNPDAIQAAIWDLISAPNQNALDTLPTFATGAIPNPQAIQDRQDMVADAKLHSNFLPGPGDSRAAILTVAEEIQVIFVEVQCPASVCIQAAGAGGPCEASAGGHAVWLPGIATDFIFSPVPGSFTENPDGTAQITGSVVSTADPNKGFQVNVSLSGRTVVPPPGSPKKDLQDCAYKEHGGPIDTATWHYYSNYNGTLTGLGDYAGAILTIVPTGPAFQVGVGANSKNLKLGASSWFIWTVTHQPNVGSALKSTGQGDFNLDIVDCTPPPSSNCVQKADAGGSCEASTGGHAVWLPGIATDFVFSPVPGSFMENPDGTAQLTGTVVSTANPNKGFQVNVSLSGRTIIPPPGSPKKDLQDCAYKEHGGPIDTATWHYYSNYNGTLTGIGDYAGAILTIVPTGPAFQVGVGANSKNLKFGASSWFIWTVTHQPNVGSALKTTGQGDFNLDIVDCTASALGTASICGSVFRDCDADGSLSGEQGFFGWTITLKYGAVDIGTKTTDVSGAFCFQNLAAGTYSVVVTPPPGYKQTVDPDGTLDNKRSITVSSGQNKSAGKFGYTGTNAAVFLVVTGPANAQCGDTITYAFAVTNTGNTCLYGIKVNDPLLGGQVFSQSTVAPGQGFMFQKTYIVKNTDPSPLVNTATAIGDPPGSLINVSNQVSVITAITCPGPVALTALTGTPANAQAKLAWQASSGATSYMIRRSTTKGGAGSTIKTGLTTTNYTDSSLSNGFAYYYVVCPMKGVWPGIDSNEESVVPTAGLPSPWITQDFGIVGDVGGASYASSKFTVAGSGADIGGTVDGFRYVYEAASGDCSIVARVTSVQNTDSSAQAGVMLRDDLTAQSKHVSMLLTPASGILFECRTNSGGNTLTVTTNGLVAPYWVKVVRSGTLFTGSVSANGSSWTVVGTRTFSMGTTVYIGLGVSSHNDGTLCTATFDNVTATP